MKNFLLSLAILGFLTPGVNGINMELADSLGLPARYFFRSEPFQPERLRGGCSGAECVDAGNYVLNQEVTGLGL